MGGFGFWGFWVQGGGNSAMYIIENFSCRREKGESFF